MTGFDIIFFWAARMIMFGMEMMGEVPFRQIHIHGLVRDAERQKMSKTKGNVIDPLVINDKYGTDAVRFGLLVSAAPGGDIALSEERIDAERAFANKIWNASRLLFSKPKEGARRADVAGGPLDREPAQCRGRDRPTRTFETHRYHEAADTLYHFFWDEFCDWYLEFKKFETDWSYAYVVYEKALRLAASADAVHHRGVVAAAGDRRRQVDRASRLSGGRSRETRDAEERDGRRSDASSPRSARTAPRTRSTAARL